MELTLTAICLPLIALASAAAVAHSRGRVEVQEANIRSIAMERGLDTSEIKQLEHLTDLVPGSSLVDLLLSPRRFNAASARYLEKVRAANPSEAQYFGRILELTRLRRRIHPPRSIVRRLDTTRELTDSLAITIKNDRGIVASGLIWSVNEDHIDIRLAANTPAALVGQRITCQLDAALGATYIFESELRTVTDATRHIVRIEHARSIRREDKGHAASKVAVSSNLTAYPA